MADQGRARGRTRARSLTQPEPVRRPGQPPEGEIPGRVGRGGPGDLPRVGEGPGRFIKSEPAAKRPRSDYPGEGATAGTSTESVLAADVSGISIAQGGDNGGGRGGGRGAWRGRRDDSNVATRPAHITDKKGTAGDPTTLVANYFTLQSTPNWAVYHYHVDFSPDIEGTRIRRALLHSHKEILGSYLFDGMALFTAHKLDDDEMDLFSERKSDNEKIRLHLKLIKELDPTNPVILQICNIQMRKNLRHLRFQQLQRYYFDMDQASSIPHHNLELWPGFMTAIHQHETSVLLCADLTFKILRCDSVLDQLRVFHQRDPRSYRDLATKELVGCIVLTRYNNKTYRIDEIDWDLTPQNTFDRRDGSKISYIDYYKQAWTITITDPKQPMLISRPKKRDMKRGMTGPIVLVPEVCIMTGLSEETRGNFQIMKEIATHTRVGPEQRAESLKKFMNRILSNAAIQEEMRGWSLSFSPDLVQFKGRNLPGEKIYQAQNKSFYYDPSSADWSRELRSSRLLHSIPIKNWALIVTRRDSNNANEFVGALSRVGPPMGLDITKPKVFPLDGDRLNDYTNALQKVISPGLQLVMTIVPNNRKDRYDAIKKLCCIDTPVPSQVVQGRTISKRQMLMSVATKIAIQLNCKLGGSAWAVELPLKNVMVIGYDSYTDSSQRGRAVGGICCSLNSTLTKYYSRVTFQTSHQEMIDGFHSNLTDGLKRYHQLNGQMPDRIFIFRDGVGEGQLQAIKEFELEQVKQCFKEIGSYEPRFAFIIVTKRINTRLFEKVGPGRLQNPRPGTVADSEITRPEWYDFFLVSQSVRQGTVSPTQYNVIHDTSGLKPDHIQRLTYKLTHLYYNWPGTVRVPAPCLYAHKLAFLTGQSLHSNPSLELADTLFFL